MNTEGRSNGRRGEAGGDNGGGEVIKLWGDTVRNDGGRQPCALLSRGKVHGGAAAERLIYNI